MKKFFRILLILFILFVVAVGAVFFILTRPGVQKRLVESQLPEGSSIGSVRLTTGSLELTELKLLLADGTELRLAAANADFKPLKAVFDRRIQIGGVNVDGLVVEIPQALIKSPPPSGSLPDKPVDPAGAEDAEPEVVVREKGKAEGSPTEALYSIGQLDWLVDIGSIHLDGELRDGAGSRYAFNLKSGVIRPGEESTIEATMSLHSGEALPAGLTKFDAGTKIFLKQNLAGGFEQVRIQAETRASDADGKSILAASQKLNLSVDGFEERASLTLEMSGDLPRPEIFLPELSGMGALNIQANLVVGAEQEALSLNEAAFELSAKKREVVSVKMNRAFTLGGENKLAGDLMDLTINKLPLAWLRPWMPEGLSLTGEDINATFNLTGFADKGLELTAKNPIRLEQLSLSQDGTPILEKMTVVLQPVIRMAEDQSIGWDLGEIKILDRYGDVLTGRSTGTFDPSATGKGFFPAGLKSKTNLDIGLQEITQQPFLSESTAIVNGKASLRVNMDSAAEYPVQLKGSILALSSRSNPNQRRSYRFSMRVNEPEPGKIGLITNFDAGPKKRPNTDLKLIGELRPEAKPLEFKTKLLAERLDQRDFEILAASFQGEADTPSSGASEKSGSKAKSGGSGKNAEGIDDESVGPPWAGYNGEVDLSVGQLLLSSGLVVDDISAKLTVTEPLVSLNQLRASLQGAKLSGSAEARYSKLKSLSYAIQSKLNVKDLNPAIFSSKPADQFPVQGTFNARANFSGLGASLEQAVDAVEGELVVTGDKGTLTAFKLDGRKNLGLVGAGLLGQGLNRPELSALAEMVPYFENVPYERFVLQLNRSSDKRIRVPQLRLVGQNLLIEGKGSIAASSLKDAMRQPLDLSLSLGAKGKLKGHLKTLNLLDEEATNNGFQMWSKTLKISGSLSDPDTSMLEQILRKAANSALFGKEGEKAGTLKESLKKKLAPEGSKEEKIMKEVEGGLNLINSVLGKESK